MSDLESKPNTDKAEKPSEKHASRTLDARERTVDAAKVKDEDDKAKERLARLTERFTNLRNQAIQARSTNATSMALGLWWKIWIRSIITLSRVQVEGR